MWSLLCSCCVQPRFKAHVLVCLLAEMWKQTLIYGSLDNWSMILRKLQIGILEAKQSGYFEQPLPRSLINWKSYFMLSAAFQYQVLTASMAWLFFFFFSSPKWTWFAPKIHSSLHTSTRSYLLFLKSKSNSELWVGKGHKKRHRHHPVQPKRANMRGIRTGLRCAVLWTSRWGENTINFVCNSLLWTVRSCRIKTWEVNCEFCKLHSGHWEK